MKNKIREIIRKHNKYRVGETHMPKEDEDEHKPDRDAQRRIIEKREEPKKEKED